MDTLVDATTEIEHALAGVVGRAFRGGDLPQLDDDAVMTLIGSAAGILRRAEALVAVAVAELQEREDVAPHADRPTVWNGCLSMKELVQRTTRASSRTTTELCRAARAIRQPVSLSSGEVLAAEYPALRQAAADGAVGLDALSAIVGALDAARCDRVVRDAAEGELAASARGEALDGGPAPDADELRLQAQVWATYLDQDGAEPRESRAMRKRGFTFGIACDGVVPFRGNALVECAAQLQSLFHSILNPKGDGAEMPVGPHFVESDPDSPVDAVADTRSLAMKQHDALMTILTVAARSGALPTIGGAAPTLVVAVDADDLASGRGQAHIDGFDEPVSLSVARQVACGGAVQRVASDAGARIRAIGIVDRVFAAHQRRAITLRDGGCVIPGCHVPAAWCEIHHVVEHARGGKTHTDNGVLLCWHHHRTLDTSGWKVRMRLGIPEVRGPSWWDSSMTWRPVTSSATRLSRDLRSRARAAPAPDR